MEKLSNKLERQLAAAGAADNRSGNEKQSFNIAGL